MLPIALWLLASTLFAQTPPAQLQTGVILPHQTCAATPDESYALYLPTHYSPDKRWPIVYVFDPNGWGDVPVKAMKDASERYGYIVVGSNNSKNGSWKIEGDAAKAMWDDTHARLAIDDHRVYFAGFSGGARVSAVLAQRCKCAAGVLLDGAGFGTTPPSRDNSFAVFSAVGIYDFNYPELSELDDKLEQAGFPHALRHFDGSHQWPPASVNDEAFAWFQLIAMKQNRAARDQAFITQQKNEAIARAKALEQSGQMYEAWREYRQAAATFDGLTDSTDLQKAAASLAQQKAVREGAKLEAQEFQEQNQLTSQIYSGLVAMRDHPVAPVAPSEPPPQRIANRPALRSHAANWARRTTTPPAPPTPFIKSNSRSSICASARRQRRKRIRSAPTVAPSWEFLLAAASLATRLSPPRIIRLRSNIICSLSTPCPIVPGLW